MSNENNKIQIDIENLFKQNVNDLSAIKELYRKLKEVEERITQIKYIDSTLANKLKKEYEKLKKIILDENVQAKLANDIESINTKLTNDIESINSQLDTIKSYKVSVKDYGAIGDGVTDDTQAIVKAIEFCSLNIFANNIKPCLYFPIGNYKITNDLNISNISLNIEMDGYLLFNNNVKHGFVLNKCKNIELDLKIKGDNMSINDFVLSDDWAVFVEGLSVGVKLIGCTSIVLSATFDKFYGRGIESYGSWQYVGGTIKGQVGQTWFMKSVSGSGLLNSGIGTIGNIYTEEICGSYFNVTDLSIQHYENYIPKSTNSKGVRFIECNSLWITTISVGYYGNDYILSLERCQGFSIQSAFVYGQWSNGLSDLDCGSGLYISECQSGFINFNSGGCKNSLLINGLVSTIINFKDRLSKNLGIVQSTETFPIKAVTINTTSKSRCGDGLKIINGGQRIDGLTINANMTDTNTNSTDIYDIHVNDSNSIIYINGKVSNLDLPSTNQCIVNCKYDTISNRALIDIKTTVENKSATCIIDGYNLAAGIQNKITRLGNVVFGSFAIEHPSKTGQLSRDSSLVSLPSEFIPSETIPITLNIICNGDNHYERSGFIDSNGNVKLIGVGIFSDDIRWVCSSFSYII